MTITTTFVTVLRRFKYLAEKVKYSNHYNTLFDKKKTNLIEVFDHIIENLDQWVDISIRESIVLQKLKNALISNALLLLFPFCFVRTVVVFADYHLCETRAKVHY
jgi:hypothetical protein